MDHDKKKLGLALLPPPDLIDAFKNPYELLNDLVNIAPLGALTTTTPSASPSLPAYLLQIPEKWPNPNWPSECCTFNFPPQKETLDLEITFPLPVLLSEAQVICGGGNGQLPSNIILEVDDDGANTIQGERFLIAPLKVEGSAPGQGAWVSIPLKEPRLVWRARLRIHKPKNSGSVNLFRIRLLDQGDAEMNGDDFNLDNFIKRIIECKVQVPDLLKYCQSVSATTGSPKTLLERVSAILRHFKMEESTGPILLQIKKEESIFPETKKEDPVVLQAKNEEPVNVEEKNLVDMPVIKELLASEKSHPKIDAIFCPDGCLKLIFEQFDPEFKTRIPPDVIPSFLRFFSLPKYREVLLGDMFNDRADCLLRLALGVGAAEILDSPVFETLDTLPYEVLSWLLEMAPSSKDEGIILRRKMVEDKAIQSVLEYFDRLTNDKNGGDAGKSQAPATITTSSLLGSNTKAKSNTNTPWAKGTGYGMGSHSTTANIWPKGTGYWGWLTGYNVPVSVPVSTDQDQAREKKQSKEEETLILLLNILTNFVKDIKNGNDQSEFLAEVNELLKKSSLVVVLSSYLRNESVLDLAGHVPLYRAIFQLLSSIAVIPELWSLFIPSEGDFVILRLLNNLKSAVTTYSQALQASNSQDWELTQLLHDIETIAAQVEGAVTEFLTWQEAKKFQKMETDEVTHNAPSKTLEDRYVEEMKKHQFAFIKMIGDGQIFLVPYHYQRQALASGAHSGQMIQGRTRRLAQESATLSTSLPLSWGSSIFLRCDNDRLDVIKVLITGPTGTPYMNGCFEFDIHFPLDYPNSPPLVNFETTGRKAVRFNPNLYNCGKVCLSILNTWSGSKEEMWNPKTSTLLPVLVAIQSLILVDEPYYNEPGYQRYGGTEQGKQSSRAYNANIQHYTVYYAIMEQIRNTNSCFKEVMQRHFWMKREEILKQCEEWKANAANRQSFDQAVAAIKYDLMNMTPPEGLEDLKDQPEVQKETTEGAKGSCGLQ